MPVPPITQEQAEALAGDVVALRAVAHHAWKDADDAERRARNLRERSDRRQQAAAEALKRFRTLFAFLFVEEADMSARAPHCDELVLHAPGTCEFCDLYPHRQAVRACAGICYTGRPEPSKIPCPSELLRPIEMIERWPGNRAAPKDAGADKDCG